MANTYFLLTVMPFRHYSKDKKEYKKAGIVMEIRVLQYFLTVAREENITRAAELLHITQPTLSRQLTELEEELGTTLLVRGKRRTTLTEDGFLLRRRAEQIVELSEITKQEFGGPEPELSGIVTIGSAEAAAAQVFPELMKQFCPQYPKVRFDFLSGNADQIRERLDRGLVDIGLLMEPVNLESYDFIRLPQVERWGVLMRKDDPLAEKDHLTADDLDGLPIITSKRAYDTGPMTGWFGDEYNKLNAYVFATYNLLGNAAMLAAHGLGYVAAIEGAAGNYDQERLCFRPFYPEVTCSAVLVWQKGQIFSPATTKFLESAKMLLRHD